MAAFNVGDRVRVVAMPPSMGLTGRVGQILQVNRAKLGRADAKAAAYLVRLDGAPPTYATVRPENLEPE